MFRIFHRTFHATGAKLNATSSLLAKLRKSTGYPLSNCKKAVELFPEDAVKAEEWLHSEAKSKGWSKLAKIQSRTAAQGLIAVISKENIGVMVEVNCETDFVARNAEFQQVVEKMLSGCVKYAENLKLQDVITKEVLEDSQLNAIQCETSTLGELVDAAMCKFNEKTVAKRAVCLKVPNDVLLNSLSHPTVVCPNLTGASLGKYGVLLASKKEADAIEENASLRLNICQHIIGMAPLSIGQLTEKDIAKFSEKCSEELETVEDIHSEQNTDNAQTQQETEKVQSEQTAEAESVNNLEDSQVEDEMMNVGFKELNETELVFQSYLMDPSVTVGETLFKSGVEVLSFERFECGEIVEDTANVAVAANA